MRWGMTVDVLLSLNVSSVRTRKGKEGFLAASYADDADRAF